MTNSVRLICIVAGLMSGHFSGPADGGAGKQTEFREFLLFENIYISNFADGINCKSSFSNLHDLSLCERVASPFLNYNDAVWREWYGRPSMFADRALSWIGMGVRPNPNPVSNLVCGRLPEIFYDKFNLRSLPNVHAINARAIDKNIRAQLSSGGAYHDHYSNDKSHRLADSGQCDGQSDDVRPPFVRRLISLFSFYFGGFFTALFGGVYFDEERRLLSAALVIAGMLAICAGVGLWWATLFPSTWEWWL